MHTIGDPAIAKHMIWQAINYVTDSRGALAGAKMLTPTLNDKFTQALSLMMDVEKEVHAVRAPAKAA